MLNCPKNARFIFTNEYLLREIGSKCFSTRTAKHLFAFRPHTGPAGSSVATFPCLALHSVSYDNHIYKVLSTFLRNAANGKFSALVNRK